MITGERIMYVDAATPVNCVFAVSIAGTIEWTILQQALAKVQARHPLLRVTIEEDRKGVPFFVSGKDIGAIPVRVVERTGEDDWQWIYREEWGKRFNLEQGPLARVVWIKGATVSELVIVCPHCICDGVSFVALMRELLLLLDNPEQTLDAYDSFYDIHEYIPEKVLKNRRLHWKGVVMSGLAGMLLPRKTPQPVSGENYLVHWRMDEEMTTRLMAACKQAKTSVHSALCIAFLQAWKEVRGKKARNKAICPVDIRRFVPEIKPDHMFAFAPIVDLTADEKAMGGFWSRAQLLKKQLADKVEQLNMSQLLMMSEYFHGAVKKMVNMLRTSNGTHDFTFSNMGQLSIPDGYRSFEVRAIYSPTVAFPWKNPNTIVVSAFKKQMDCVIISRDSFFSKKDAALVRNKVMEILEREINRDAEKDAQQESGQQAKWMQQFMVKNITLYAVTNLLVNWAVSYYGFDNRQAVSLFGGAHPYARFLLPMVLFLPFCITYDITHKAILFFERQNKVLMQTASAKRKQFVLKLAAKNAAITFIPVAIGVVLMHLLLPEDYTFNGAWLAVVQGLLAGLLAVFFTLYGVRYIQKRTAET